MSTMRTGARRTIPFALSCEDFDVDGAVTVDNGGSLCSRQSSFPWNVQSDVVFAPSVKTPWRHFIISRLSAMTAMPATSPRRLSCPLP